MSRRNKSVDKTLSRLFGETYAESIAAGTLTPFAIVVELRKRYTDHSISLVLRYLRARGLAVAKDSDYKLVLKRKRTARVSREGTAEAVAAIPAVVDLLLDSLRAPSTTRSRRELAFSLLLVAAGHTAPRTLGARAVDSELRKTYGRNFGWTCDASDIAFSVSEDGINKATVAAYIDAIHKAPARSLGVRFFRAHRVVLVEAVRSWIRRQDSSSWSVYDVSAPTAGAS